MPPIQNLTVLEQDNGIRLDRWFSRYFPNVSHVTIEKALRKGQIRVDGKRAKASFRVETGQSIRIPPLVEYVPKPKAKASVLPKDAEMIRKAVLFKDKDIIVLNKPAGLAVQGGQGVKLSVDSLLDELRFDAEERPKLVHRLDKDTSGLLLLARSTAVAARLTRAFKDKQVQKTYWALVVGVPVPPQGKVTVPIAKGDSGAGKEKMLVDEDEGDKAVTHYRIIEAMAKTLALMELVPITGRTHQLRVHMAHIGYPILGDGKYGGKAAFIDGLGRNMCLHARQLLIPGYSKPFTAPLTGTMAKTFESLGLHG